MSVIWYLFYFGSFCWIGVLLCHAHTSTWFKSDIYDVGMFGMFSMFDCLIVCFEKLIEIEMKKVVCFVPSRWTYVCLIVLKVLIINCWMFCEIICRIVWYIPYIYSRNYVLRIPVLKTSLKSTYVLYLKVTSYCVDTLLKK